jgi:cytochrome c
MKPCKKSEIAASVISLMIAAMPASLSAQSVNVETAEALLKSNKCTQCHVVDRKKDGPSYKEIAKKNAGKPDAEARLLKHLTSSPKIKVDGAEEEHRNIKAKSDEEIRNVVRYILSR